MSDSQLKEINIEGQRVFIKHRGRVSFAGAHPRVPFSSKSNKRSLGYLFRSHPRAPFAEIGCNLDVIILGYRCSN